MQPLCLRAACVLPATWHSLVSRHGPRSTRGMDPFPLPPSLAHLHTPTSKTAACRTFHPHPKRHPSSLPLEHYFVLHHVNPFVPPRGGAREDRRAAHSGSEGGRAHLSLSCNVRQASHSAWRPTPTSHSPLQDTLSCASAHLHTTASRGHPHLPAARQPFPRHLGMRVSVSALGPGC